MTKRDTLLMGSMPFTDEETAMQHAIDKLGSRLFSLPDGEIGEKTEKMPAGTRCDWIMTVINALEEDTTNWTVVDSGVRNERGSPASYQLLPRLKPKHSPADLPQHLNFGYHTYFQNSYPIFKKLRKEKGLNDLKFQVGVPTGLNITLAMMSPLTALRYADAFSTRIAWEVNEILKIAGDDVLIQIEVPFEVGVAYRLPGFLGGLAVRTIHNLVRKIDASATLGVHLCLGDLNNEASTPAPSLDKLVQMSNRMVDGWPQSHNLTYVHFPLAEAADPPPLDASFYAPLGKVRLPKGTRFIAGFVHEKRSVKEHQQILEIIENLRGQTVGVACSCGLGRRSEPVADTLMQMTAQVAGMVQLH